MLNVELGGVYSLLLADPLGLVPCSAAYELVPSVDYQSLHGVRPEHRYLIC